MNASDGTLRRFRVPLLRLCLIVAVLAGFRWSIGASAAPAPVKYGGSVSLVDVGGSLWDCGFNPYVGNETFVTDGVTYETLLYINPLNSKVTPMLATGYRWGNGNKSLTLTIRSGVTWTDGKAFTPADVIFTFQMLKRFSALDGNAVWSVLSGVKQQGNEVVFSFKHPAVPFFYYIAGETYIVPKHIWASVKDPSKYVDKNPVATGPMVLKRCTPQDMTFTRNSHYWMKGRPYIQTLQIPAFIDNTPGNLQLRTGQANWGCQYIPNVQAYYLSVNSHHHIWYPPSSDNVLFLNVKQYPLTILNVRKAISLAIDKSEVSRLGVYGYEPAANQSGIVLPNFKSWYDSALAKKNDYSFSVSRAQTLLKQAGFTKGSNGIFQKNGKPLSVTILGVSGFSDFVSELSIVERNLKAAGIDARVDNVGGNTQSADLSSGKFQIGYLYTTGGPSPYYQFYNTLYGSSSGNYSGWKDKTTDRLLNQYAATTSSAKQHAIINQIQGIMLQKVPVVPLVEGVYYSQYDTSKLVGWPSQSDPYMAPCDQAGMGLTVSHVHLP
jgi:peptide/nickel transport system substrate-binding protein